MEQAEVDKQGGEALSKVAMSLDEIMNWMKHAIVVQQYAAARNLLEDIITQHSAQMDQLKQEDNVHAIRGGIGGAKEQSSDQTHELDQPPLPKT